MPVLTLETLIADPWNAVAHDLPSNASRVFLEMVRDAARQCVTGHHALMMAARHGDYTAWTPDHESPDAHEEAEAYWLEALARYDLIEKRLREL